MLEGCMDIDHTNLLKNLLYENQTIYIQIYNDKCFRSNIKEEFEYIYGMLHVYSNVKKLLLSPNISPELITIFKQTFGDKYNLEIELTSSNIISRFEDCSCEWIRSVSDVYIPKYNILDVYYFDCIHKKRKHKQRVHEIFSCAVLKECDYCQDDIINFISL